MKDENKGQGHPPACTSAVSGVTWKRSCINSSLNFVAGQNELGAGWSLSRQKNWMYRYSLNIGPMAPSGGHFVSLVNNSGKIGLPSVVARFTWEY
jgi:hypothetical protein